MPETLQNVGRTSRPQIDSARFDRLRRNRYRFEYGSRTFGKAEVAEAIDTANAIRAACTSVI